MLAGWHARADKNTNARRGGATAQVFCAARDLQSCVAEQASTGLPVVIVVEDIDTVKVCLNFLELLEVVEMRALYELHSETKQFSIYEQAPLLAPRSLAPLLLLAASVRQCSGASVCVVRAESH